MLWLRLRAPWLLLTMTVLVAVVGLWALIIGIKEAARAIPASFWCIGSGADDSGRTASARLASYATSY